MLPDSVGSRACSEENDGGSAQTLEGEGGKKICPYCFQQLSWHALSRHIRDMHRSDAGVTGLKRYFCALTPSSSFAAARPMLTWWCASTAWKLFGIRILLVATYGGDILWQFSILVSFISLVIVWKLFKVPQTWQRTDYQRAGISSIKSTAAIIRPAWKSITFSRNQFCFALAHLSDLKQ